MSDSPRITHFFCYECDGECQVDTSSTWTACIDNVNLRFGFCPMCRTQCYKKSLSHLK